MCSAPRLRIQGNDIIYFSSLSRAGSGFTGPVASLSTVATDSFAVLATHGEPRPCRSSPETVCTQVDGSIQTLRPELLSDGILARHARGVVEVWGSAMGTSAVFWGTTPLGTYVVADSAAAVARILSAEIAEDRIALALAGDVTIQIADARPFWHSVHAVRPGDLLILTRGHEPRTRRWWSPPPADQDLASTAAAVRDSLDTALSSAVACHPHVTADLSGGLDSTSIVFALAAQGATPVTFRANSGNVYNDDGSWANRTARELRLDLHDLGPLAGAYGPFDSRDPLQGDLDTPAPWRGSIGYLLSLHESLRTMPGVHFTGLGGDELFAFSPIILWSLAQATSPRHPSIRRFRSLHRWPRLATLKAVKSRGDFQSGIAEQLGARPRSEPEAALAWAPPITFPTWLTAGGISRAHSLVREVLTEGLAPWDEDRSRHHALESLHFQGGILRQISQALPWSSTWQAPFLNTSVVEAVLRLDVRARVGTGIVKPLLAAAMAPDMPADYFRRTGKGEYSEDIFHAAHARRASLLDFFEESTLALRGFIDLPRLRGAINSPMAPGDGLADVERAVAVELWLRAQTRVAAPRSTERNSYDHARPQVPTERPHRD